MVRSASPDDASHRRENHEAPDPTLRDAAEWPLLRVRKSVIARSGATKQSTLALLPDGLLRSARNDGAPHTGSAIEYFTWLKAKLDSIEAMPSRRVSLFFRNASYEDRSAATTRSK